MARETRVALEQLILEYIHDFYMETGVPPTYREIAKHVGSSHSNVWQAVRALRKGGFLRESSVGIAARSLLLSPAGFQRVIDSSATITVVSHPGGQLH